MRHKHSGRKLGRRADHRKAMLKNLAEALILNGRIETTVTRAKETRRLVERLVTIARRGDLHARRLVAARLHTPAAVRKLVEEIAPNYRDRNGGYTRVIKTGFRRGDAAPLAILEFVEPELPKKKKKKKKPAVPARAESAEPAAPEESTGAEGSAAGSGVHDAQDSDPDSRPGAEGEQVGDSESGGATEPPVAEDDTKG